MQLSCLTIKLILLDFLFLECFATSYFYVSSAVGDDTEGDGSQTNPFATLQHAQLAARAVSRPLTEPIIIRVRGGGPYYLAPLELIPDDSGSSSENIVSWEPWDLETYGSPVISGGLQVTGWQQIQDNLWEVVLPSDSSYFRRVK